MLLDFLYPHRHSLKREYRKFKQATIVDARMSLVVRFFMSGVYFQENEKFRERVLHRERNRLLSLNVDLLC